MPTCLCQLDNCFRLGKDRFDYSAAGALQFEPSESVHFSNWNLSAKGVKGPFTVIPPENAEKIPLIIRNRAKAGIPAQEGGVK